MAPHCELITGSFPFGKGAIGDGDDFIDWFSFQEYLGGGLGHVVPIVDEFGVDLIEIKNGTKRSGFAVVKGAHRVVRVGSVGESGLDGGLNFGIGGVGMSGRNNDASLVEYCDEGNGVRLFRGEGDETETGIAQDLLPVQGLSGDWDDGLWGLGTWVFGGYKGTFEVESPDEGMIGEVVDRGLNCK